MRQSGESIRLLPEPPMCRGFDSHVTRGLTLFVLYSSPRAVSPGIPVFRSPQKPYSDTLERYNSLTILAYVSKSIRWLYPFALITLTTNLARVDVPSRL